MSAILLALLPLAASLAIPSDSSYGVAFGNYFSTGPVANDSWIRESTTTLVLPDLNKPHVGNMALWPGMGTSGGDLIQGLAISTVGDGSPCDMGADDLKWCVTASTLQENQEDGTAVTASPGDKVKYKYKYNDNTKKYDQTVSVNGKVVSKLSTVSGHGLGWGTAIECQVEACGTVPQHHYINTKLIMDVADPNYVQTLALNNAKGDLVTSDGGKTWTVDTITIDKYTFT